MAAAGRAAAVAAAVHGAKVPGAKATEEVNLEGSSLIWRKF